MEQSSIFTEIFGFDPTTVHQPVPAVPLLDDELAKLMPSTGAADSLCEQLQDADLRMKLIGTEDIPRPKPAPIAAPIPAPALFSSALNNFEAEFTTSFAKQFASQRVVKRRAASGTGGHWDSAKHETVLRRIINRTRAADAFAPIKDSASDGLWDRLVQSCVDHVCASVHEAAEDGA